LIGLSLTVFELSRFEIWPHPRAVRDPPPTAQKREIAYRPRAVASAFSRGSDVDECVSERVIVRRRLNVTFDRQNSRLFAEQSNFVDILCRKSTSFGNSRIVLLERIFCVIHRELATSRRRFELSANLHCRGWIPRWLL